METLARVRLTFRGLRARDWHIPEAAEVGDNPTTFSASVDIRRFSQLLSAQRTQPSWFICSKSFSFLYFPLLNRILFLFTFSAS